MHHAVVNPIDSKRSENLNGFFKILSAPLAEKILFIAAKSLSVNKTSGIFLYLSS